MARSTQAAKDRLQRHHERLSLGERLAEAGTAYHDMDADELAASKTYLISRNVNMRATVKHLDPRSAKRKPIDQECALNDKILDRHVIPALIRAKHEQVLQICEEWRDSC